MHDLFCYDQKVPWKWQNVQSFQARLQANTWAAHTHRVGQKGFTGDENVVRKYEFGTHSGVRGNIDESRVGPGGLVGFLSDFRCNLFGGGG